MERAELKKVWDLHGLSCRDAIDTEYAKKFCEKVNITFKDSLIYTKPRYREQSDGKPRVDCEDLLIYVCKQLKIEPNQNALKGANMFHGEGSRRQAIEEAYLSLR